MVRIWPATHCPITERSDSNVIRSLEFSGVNFEKEGFYWVYPEADNKVLVVTDELFNNRKLWKEHKREIEYLIFNDRWPKNFRMVDSEMLEALISSSRIPNSPFEKINEVLFYLANKQKYFGEQLKIDRFDFNDVSKKTGLINDEELEGIIREAGKSGFLNIFSDYANEMTLNLSLKGWELANEKDKQKNSKSTFVAMSFDPEMIKIYNQWIEPAIRESGFDPYIVLDKNPESDVTINDAILAGIKKARFTIADFTHHKSGVYFEAGYALGRGQKVIYTCREDHIGTAHFDTRNYQHLVWKDGADLKEKLMDKIEVFIKT